MKRFLLTFVLLGVYYFGMAQKPKVAVYIAGGAESGVIKILGDQLVSAIANSGKYVAVERTSSFLAELSKEQGYQRSGAVSDNDIARLGQQFGVQLVCVAEVSEAFGEKYISARLVNVENAEIAVTANARSALSNMDELMQTCKKLGKDLSQETLKEKEIRQAETVRKEEEEKKKRQTVAEKIKEHWRQGYFLVYDNLYVQNAINAIGNTKDLESVVTAAGNSRVGGYTDWRLPKPEEIRYVFNGYESLLNFWHNTYSYSDKDYALLPNKSELVGCPYWKLEDSYFVTKDDNGTITCYHLESGKRAKNIGNIVYNGGLVYYFFVRDK